MFMTTSGVWWKRTTPDFFFSPCKSLWQARLSNTLWKCPGEKSGKANAWLRPASSFYQMSAAWNSDILGFSEIILASNNNSVLILVAVKKYGKKIHDNKDAWTGAHSYTGCWVSKTCSRGIFAPERSLLGVASPHSLKQDFEVFMYVVKNVELKM